MNVQQYFGWIPVLSGCLRYSDCLGHSNEPKSPFKIYCYDSDHAVDKSKKNVNENRMIKILVQVKHKDEVLLVRIMEDVRLWGGKQFLKIKAWDQANCLKKYLEYLLIFIFQLKRRVRHRLIGYYFEIEQSKRLSEFGRPDEACGTWSQLEYTPDYNVNKGLDYKFKTSNVKTESVWNAFVYPNVAGKGIITHKGGTLRIRDTGFAYLAIDTHAWRDSKLVANQVYYALKTVFHRHKYHDAYSDGILKAYAKDADFDASTVEQLQKLGRMLSRVSKRLARAVTLQLTKISWTPEIHTARKGNLAYLLALSSAVKRELGAGVSSLPNEEGFAAIQTAVDGELEMADMIKTIQAITIAVLGIGVTLLATLFMGHNELHYYYLDLVLSLASKIGHLAASEMPDIFKQELQKPPVNARLELILGEIILLVSTITIFTNVTIRSISRTQLNPNMALFNAVRDIVAKLVFTLRTMTKSESEVGRLHNV